MSFLDLGLSAELLRAVADQAAADDLQEPVRRRLRHLGAHAAIDAAAHDERAQLDVAVGDVILGW